MRGDATKELNRCVLNQRQKKLSSRNPSLDSRKQQILRLTMFNNLGNIVQDKKHATF